jgi:hypothetical protein
MKNLIFVLALLLTSCGARKVAINNTEVKKDSTAITEVKVETETKVETEETTNVFVFEECEEIEITPIDTSKVMLVNGKTYKNVSIKAKKKKIGSSYTNTIKTSDVKTVDSIAKSVIVKKENTVVKTKDVDKKEAVSLNVLWWILIILLILFIIRTINSYLKPFR